MTTLRTVGFTSVALALTLTAAGCASPAPSAAPLPDDAVVIDVRTAEEYASAHLDSAVLLDVSNGDLEAALADLDPDVPYFVHCRSGNRSAVAVAMMRDAGFTDVTDLGSLEQAADATGLPIER
ncbi:rhodanese-like domain-containing protein [Agrococcus sp. ProA11]|uniref:rhodanese-like domain-containing protein n=1 Tax=Agrococcus chionoecetis TaxID=3153752 RepID=UPI00326114E1